MMLRNNSNESMTTHLRLCGTPYCGNAPQGLSDSEASPAPSLGVVSSSVPRITLSFFFLVERDSKSSSSPPRAGPTISRTQQLLNHFLQLASSHQITDGQLCST